MAAVAPATTASEFQPKRSRSEAELDDAQDPVEHAVKRACTERAVAAVAAAADVVAASFESPEVLDEASDDDDESASAPAGPTMFERAQALLATKQAAHDEAAAKERETVGALGELTARHNAVQVKVEAALLARFGKTSTYLSADGFGGDGLRARLATFNAAEVELAASFGAPCCGELEAALAAKQRAVIARIAAAAQLARAQALADDPLIDNYETLLEQFTGRRPAQWECASCLGLLRWKDSWSVTALPTVPVACQECKGEGRDDDDAHECGVCACGIRFCADCVHAPIEGTEAVALVRSDCGIQCMACAYIVRSGDGGGDDKDAGSSSSYESEGRGSEFDSSREDSGADE